MLNGEKRWIGNGSVGDVVWARDADDGQEGFLVEKGTQALIVGREITGVGAFS